MKKVLMIISGMLLTAGANAQMSWGLQGGVNLNNQLDHYQGETVSNQLKVGVQAGAVMEWSLCSHWSIQDGLLYSLKGGQQDRQFTYLGADGTHDVKLKNKNSLHYIEMPVDLVYKAPVGNGHFFIGAGPYAAILLRASSTYKVKNSMNGIEIAPLNSDGSRTLNVGDDSNDDIHRFDFGINGMLGYQMANGWFIKGSVDAGLLNVIRTDNIAAYQNSLPATVNNSDPSSKNMTYTIGIGYMF